jgi:hypothetical protein
MGKPCNCGGSGSGECSCVLVDCNGEPVAGQGTAESPFVIPCPDSITIRESGVDQGSRPNLNFIQGAGISLVITDDGGNDEVDITIAATGGGGSGLTIQRNDVPVGTRPILNFIVGNNMRVTALDDPAGTEVDLTLAADVTVRRAGVAIGTRRAINFIPGTGITIAAVNDAPNDEVDVTITNADSISFACTPSCGQAKRFGYIFG